MSTKECPLVLNPNPDGHPRRYKATSSQQAKRKCSSCGMQKSLMKSKQSSSFFDNIDDSSCYQRLSIEDSHSMRMNPLTQTGEQREQLGEHPKLSYKVKFASFFFTFIVFLLVLVSAALSKVCFTNIAAQLNANSPVGQGSSGEKRRSVAFVQLVLVLCVPQVVTILKTLFLGILGKTTKHFPWPSKPALLKGVLVAAAEAVCLSAFTMFVATQADSAAAILLIPGVYTFTALSSMCSERVRRIMQLCCKAPRAGENDQGNSTDVSSPPAQGCWEKFRKRVVNVLDSKPAKLIGFLLQIAGLLAAAVAMFTYPLSQNQEVHKETVFVLVCFPVCGIMLSFLWSSMVQSAIFKSEQQRTEQEFEGHPTYLGSYKGGFVYAWVRLLLIPFICYGLVKSLQLSPNVSIAIGFTDWKVHEHLVFFLQVLGALFTVLFSLIALWSTFQPWVFTLPLLLSTPIAVFWFWIQHGLRLSAFPFGDHNPSAEYISYLNGDLILSIIVECILVTLWLGEILCLGAQIWNRPKIPLARENTLYLSPAYDSIFLDSYLLLNRLSAQSLYLQCTKLQNVAEQSRTSMVFICSTMFREAEHEMKQMLKSINRVAQRATSGEQSDIAQFESHIFFDGAVSSDQFQEFSSQLLSLLEETLEVTLGDHDMKKYMTPYGYQLFWMVENTLPFYIHFKDNTKVKNKKRWSQVMYMNYIIEHRLNERYENGALKYDPHSTYILTTDADINFSPDSVAALLDFLVRDDSVGAVCARTHPVGSGPLVWYQIFEYAFGHWFQKSAEHVLGCVLCCPGCFSVFRVSAITDVVKTYQSSVTTAFEFLTKDMGEDRWLCTLLIQKGWRLEYAALPQNSTYCPESFDEFFNQRRRWVPSTLANLIELITSSGLVTSGNDSISYLFIIYQLILFFSAAISPSTVILVIASGLATTTLNITGAVTIVILSAITLLYVAICLWTPEKVQLFVSKVLTFFMGAAMVVAFAGVMVDAVKTVIQLSMVAGNTTEINAILEEDGLPLDATYLLGFSLIVIIAGMMHGTGFKVLIHFVWYIVGFPASYLLLIIYSACNLHNRSWGTRVGITETSGSESKLVAVYNNVTGVLFEMWSAFVACLRRKKGEDTPPDPPTAAPEGDVEAGQPRVDVEEVRMKEDLRKWLKENMQCDQDYISKFQENGYTRFEFLEGMSLKDLKEIGIDRRGYRLRLFQEIRKNPSIPNWQGKRIPTSVPSFLGSLKLGEYVPLFQSEGYYFPDDVENLIGLNETHLKKMGITKKAHLNQLMKGLEHLQYPTYRDRKIRCAKHKVETDKLDKLDDKQEEFWSKMVHTKGGLLRPESAQLDGSMDNLKGKLRALRNYTVLALVFINTMWMALILFIGNLGGLLEMVYIKAGPISSLFLVSYFLVFIIQFGALLIHRMETLLHVMACTSLPQKVQRHWFIANVNSQDAQGTHTDTSHTHGPGTRPNSPSAQQCPPPIHA